MKTKHSIFIYLHLLDLHVRCHRNWAFRVIGATQSRPVLRIGGSGWQHHQHQLWKRGIERGLSLAALVSITDHDNIEAASKLRALEETKQAPVSVEWTVPFGLSYFHIGIHDLPPEQADTLMRELNRFTSS